MHTLAAPCVPSFERRVRFCTVGAGEQLGCSATGIARLKALYRIRKYRRCLFGETKGAVDRHDCADQVGALYRQPGSDLSAHRVTYEHEFLSFVFRGNQSLEIGNEIVWLVGPGRRHFRAAVTAQIDGHGAVLTFELGQLPAPVVRVAAPSMDEHHVAAGPDFGVVEAGLLMLCRCSLRIWKADCRSACAHKLQQVTTRNVKIIETHGYSRL